MFKYERAANRYKNAVIKAFKLERLKHEGTAKFLFTDKTYF